MNQEVRSSIILKVSKEELYMFNKNLYIVKDIKANLKKFQITLINFSNLSLYQKIRLKQNNVYLQKADFNEMIEPIRNSALQGYSDKKMILSNFRNGFESKGEAWKEMMDGDFEIIGSQKN